MKRAAPTVAIYATLEHIAVNAADLALASLTTDAGEQITIPAALLPDGAAIGDVLLIRVSIDPDATAARAARVNALQRKLFG